MFQNFSFWKIIIFLFISLTILSCKTSSSNSASAGKGETSAGAAASAALKNNSGSNSAAKTLPKSSFSQKEMELFYSNVSVKKIVRANKKFLPVTEGKKPVFVSCICNNDDNTEFFVLFAESISDDDVSSISIDSVSDLRNIYREDIYLRQFLLAVYKYYENSEEKKFIHEQNIILDGKGAFSSLKEILIDKNSKIYGVSANFITSTGTHEDIVIKRNERYSITTIKNTLSDSTRKEDIDNNGIIDFVRYEKIFVDGFGVETFITWYRFNGEQFLPVKTVNTVKDIRAFLKESKMFLETKRTDLFIKNTIAPVVLKKLNLAKISSDKIMQRIFYPVKRESSYLIDINTMLSSSDNIDFIFPEIFENPFRVDNDGNYSFTTYVRVLLKNDNIIITPDNKSPGAEDILVNEEIYLVKIYMANNPFEDPRFFFFVN